MSKKKHHITNDISSIILDSERLIPELKQLSKSLKRYVELRRIDNTRERVQLIFVIAALLDWPENEFNNVMNRINKIRLKADTGIDVEQIIKELTEQAANTMRPTSVKH